MKPNVRRNLPGTFLTQDLGQGAWRLSRSEPKPIEVFVRGADFRAAEGLAAASAVRDVDIEWRGEAVVLTVTSGERRGFVDARSAIVHEPLGRLYESAAAGQPSTRRRGAFGAECSAWCGFPAAAGCSGFLARRRACPALNSRSASHRFG